MVMVENTPNKNDVIDVHVPLIKETSHNLDPPIIHHEHTPKTITSFTFCKYSCDSNWRAEESFLLCQLIELSRRRCQVRVQKSKINVALVENYFYFYCLRVI